MMNDQISSIHDLLIDGVVERIIERLVRTEVVHGPSDLASVAFQVRKPIEKAFGPHLDWPFGVPAVMLLWPLEVENVRSDAGVHQLSEAKNHRAPQGFVAAHEFLDVNIAS